MRWPAWHGVLRGMYCAASCNRVDISGCICQGFVMEHLSENSKRRHQRENSMRSLNGAYMWSETQQSHMKDALPHYTYVQATSPDRHRFFGLFCLLPAFPTRGKSGGCTNLSTVSGPSSSNCPFCALFSAFFCFLRSALHLRKHAMWNQGAT